MQRVQKIDFRTLGHQNESPIQGNWKLRPLGESSILWESSFLPNMPLKKIWKVSICICVEEFCQKHFVFSSPHQYLLVRCRHSWITGEFFFFFFKAKSGVWPSSIRNHFHEIEKPFLFRSVTQISPCEEVEKSLWYGAKFSLTLARN